MAKKTKRMLYLNKQRIALVIGALTALILTFVPSIIEIPQVQELVALNMTAKNFLEVTKMPGWWIFAPLAVLVIVGFVYLCIRESKPDKDEKMRKEISAMRKDIRNLTSEIRKANHDKSH